MLCLGGDEKIGECSLFIRHYEAEENVCIYAAQVTRAKTIKKETREWLILNTVRTSGKILAHLW